MKKHASLILALLILLGLGLSGCNSDSSTPADQRQDFHRDMHFTVVYPDGSHGTQFTGTLDAIWTEEKDNDPWMKLTIDFSSEEYPYKPLDSISMPCMDHDDHYQGNTSIYNNLTNFVDYGSFELDKQGNHVILYWSNAGHVLVGTCDPNEDPNTLLKQHERCLPSLCKEWWEMHTQPRKLNINMSLSGVWVTADGEVQSHLERVLFTVSGWLPAEFEPYSNVVMELDFCWPESFGYQNEGKQTYAGGASMTDRHDFQHAIYHGAGWLRDPKHNEVTSLSFTICPESNFVVVHVGDRYLVASTDPNADPAEIFAIYDAYAG